MKIKLQGLLNGVTAIRDEYGEEALARILAACGPAVQERCESGISIEWHEALEFCEFLEHAESQLGRGDARISEMIGAAGARVNTGAWYKRAAMLMANPENVMRRVTSAWDRFNDEGSFDLIEVSEGHSIMTLSGVGLAHPLFCATLTGWATVMSERVGWNDAKVEHFECRGRGDGRCAWETSWTP